METARRRRMPNRWTLESDLQARLGGCFFIFDGQYVQIQIASESSLHVLDGLTQEPITKIQPDDPRLDVNSIEVGYANILTSQGLLVVYASREPSKRWKQGIDASNIGFRSVAGQSMGGVYNQPGGRTAYLVQAPGFRDSILGRFPNPSAAISGLSTTMPVIAISQAYALKMIAKDIIGIDCRTETVGHIIDGNLRLEDRRGGFIIREELEELGLRV